ncbi:MAG: KEOPS complex subunit Pcc1 [Nitrososphaerota archaeon]|nr:KEOPS complex subunit Pcc1 [Nitrososphaerota archaeon]
MVSGPLRIIGLASHRSNIEMSIESPHLDEIYRALSIEASDLRTRRVSVTLSREADSILLRIQASDVTSLRAACNSFLRWLLAIRSTLDLVR